MQLYQKTPSKVSVQPSKRVQLAPVILSHHNLAVVAFYPVTRPILSDTNRPHYREFKGLWLPRLPPFVLSYFTRAYIPHTASLDDPRLSPDSNAPSAFPDKALLVICGLDPLYDEGIRLGKALKAEGKNVDVMEIPEAWHAWDKEVKDGTKDDQTRVLAYDRAAETLRNAYQR